VRLEVSDHGTGILPEHLGRIFDPYFTTKREGTGLGLTTSYAIVSKHAGHLGVRSAVGQGSTFTIHVPAHDGQPAVVPEPDPAPPSNGKNRVLVMDDEGMVRNVVGEMLVNAGYDVVLVADGEEAVITYQEARDVGARFDAVILDLTVRGGVGGKEAMRRLLDLDPDTVGIVCSGYSDDPVMGEFEVHGFKGRIAKPFVSSALMTTLAQVLDV
jgi:CheY-like chemotaxis protein